MKRAIEAAKKMKFVPAVDDPRIATFFHYLSLKKQDGAIEVSNGVQSGDFDPTAEPIYTSKEVDTKARLISKPEPQYTNRARNDQVTGMVVLKAIFAGNGQVVNIRVVQGAPSGLTDAAIAAARKIKFIPATKNGKTFPCGSSSNTISIFIDR